MRKPLSITIRIGSRTYPLSVSSEEEHILRKSARDLNERVKTYTQTFKVEDEQDLIAMVAFDLTVEHNKRTQIQSDQQQELIEKVGKLQEILSQAQLPHEIPHRSKLSDTTLSEKPSPLQPSQDPKATPRS